MVERMVIDEERPSGPRSNEREPERSVEGWVVFVRGVHEEADEDALTEYFAEFGTVKNVNLNLDRRTGFVKGYAFIEYESRREAQTAIEEADGSKFLGQTLQVSYAFLEAPEQRVERKDRRGRGRSASPSQR
ncbi:RNA-binding domain-containing protein [Hesseltinella vesiculosa]|uniref:RNA-binding domain-containing protein n=1 Tax=Hesseltinella vesiculosa TaxID=101127 RepID=A0A1X2GIL4_9FUNG|nr:RNA-binding domain-containing protein [Hesseltinella vesiculosa]